MQAAEHNLAIGENEISYDIFEVTLRHALHRPKN